MPVMMTFVWSKTFQNKIHAIIKDLNNVKEHSDALTLKMRLNVVIYTLM